MALFWEKWLTICASC
jgi:ubiquitin carboxyl-terminal hydrolase 10